VKTFAEIRAGQAAKQKARYDARKAAGLCPRCGGTPRLPPICDACRAKWADASRKRVGCGEWRPGMPGRPPADQSLAWLDAIGNL
jgi:hypothetical protein